jgi:lipopolysaccharide/colanic/teichoic acid biosynthesis glycosyltransferase
MSRTERSRGPERNFQLGVKRVFDILIAAVVLLLLSPLFLVVAIAVKLDSIGTVFARQPRYCYDNRLIHILRFRCTTTDQTDTITRIGLQLSRNELDKLPMLINVLRGDMSIVGLCSFARPPSLLFSPEFPDALRRSKLRPGLLFRDKLKSHHSETQGGTRWQIEDDLFYVTCWSIWLDAKIIVKRLISKSFYTIG